MFLDKIIGKKFSINRPIFWKEISFLNKGFLGTLSIKQFFLSIKGVDNFFLKRVGLFLGVRLQRKASTIEMPVFLKVEKFLSKRYLTNLYLQKEFRDRIQELMNLSTHKGFRHRMGLPVNGQRSYRNAKTAKRMMAAYKFKIDIKRYRKLVKKLEQDEKKKEKTGSGAPVVGSSN